MRQRPSGISRPRRVRVVGGTARPGGHSDRSGRTSGDRRRCATGRARRRRQRLRGQPTPGITGSIPDRVEVGSHAHRVGDQTGIPVAIAHRAPSPHPVGVARHERLGEHDQLGVRRADLAGGRLDGPSAVEEHRCGLDRRHRQRSAAPIEGHGARCSPGFGWPDWVHEVVPSWAPEYQRGASPLERTPRRPSSH